MNYGKFFRLNLKESKLVDGIAVYDYIDLPAYFGSTKPISPKYPITLIITKNCVKFRLHYCAYNVNEGQGTGKYFYEMDDAINEANKSSSNIEKNLLNGSLRGEDVVQMVHMQEVFLELPFENTNRLSSLIKHIYYSHFPHLDKGEGFLNMLIDKRYGDYFSIIPADNATDEKQYKTLRQSIDGDRSYSTLWLMGLGQNENNFSHNGIIERCLVTTEGKRFVWKGNTPCKLGDYLYGVDSLSPVKKGQYEIAIVGSDETATISVGKKGVLENIWKSSQDSPEVLIKRAPRFITQDGQRFVWQGDNPCKKGMPFLDGQTHSYVKDGEYHFDIVGSEDAATISVGDDGILNKIWGEGGEELLEKAYRLITKEGKCFVWEGESPCKLGKKLYDGETCARKGLYAIDIIRSSETATVSISKNGILNDIESEYPREVVLQRAQCIITTEGKRFVWREGNLCRLDVYLYDNESHSNVRSGQYSIRIKGPERNATISIGNNGVLKSIWTNPDDSPNVLLAKTQCLVTKDGNCFVWYENGPCKLGVYLFDSESCSYVESGQYSIYLAGSKGTATISVGEKGVLESIWGDSSGSPDALLKRTQCLVTKDGNCLLWKEEGPCKFGYKLYNGESLVKEGEYTIIIGANKTATISVGNGGVLNSIWRNPEDSPENLLGRSQYLITEKGNCLVWEGNDPCKLGPCKLGDHLFVDGQMAEEGTYNITIIDSEETVNISVGDNGVLENIWKGSVEDSPEAILNRAQHPYYTGFLRKLLLDFMFDLQHSDVFQSSNTYNEMYSGLMSNFFFSSLIHKCEYYYYRGIVKDVVKKTEGQELTGEDKKTKLKNIGSLYAPKLFDAEKQWVEDIMNPSAERAFNYVPNDFNSQNIKGDFLNRCKDFVKRSIDGLRRIYNSNKFIVRNQWFVAPEEELQRICFTKEDCLTNNKKHVCSSNDLAEYLGISRTNRKAINALRTKESQWFFKRFDFRDAYHLHLFKYSHLCGFGILFALVFFTFLFCHDIARQSFWDNKSAFLVGGGVSYLFIVIFAYIRGYMFTRIYYAGAEDPLYVAHKNSIWKRAFFGLSLIAVPIVMMVVGAWRLEMTWIKWMTLIIGIIILQVLIWRSNGVSNIHLVYPRLIASITAAWLTLAIGNELFQTFYKEKVSPFSCVILGIIVLFFLMYEINRQLPYVSVSQKIWRSIQMLVFSYAISLAIGISIINFIGKESLQASDKHLYCDSYVQQFLWDLDGYKFLFLPDFLIQFAFLAMFIGIFIQMLFEEKNITEV